MLIDARLGASSLSHWRRVIEIKRL